MKKALIVMMSLLTISTISPKTIAERRAERQAERQERKQERRKKRRAWFKKLFSKAKKKALARIEPLIDKAIDKGSDVAVKKAIEVLNKAPMLSDSDKKDIIKKILEAEKQADEKLPNLAMKILEKDSFKEMAAEAKKIVN